jgi:CheY-like chemotaxis protein
MEHSPRGAVTVLVVDDDADWRILVRESLEQAGFRVVEAARGDAAVTSVEHHQPDIVVLDHHMPGVNGLDLIAFLHRRWPALPLVLTSAFGDASLVKRAQQLGATRYLDKPCHLDTLVTEIAALSESR